MDQRILQQIQDQKIISKLNLLVPILHGLSNHFSLYYITKICRLRINHVLVSYYLRRIISICFLSTSLVTYNQNIEDWFRYLRKLRSRFFPPWNSSFMVRLQTSSSLWCSRRQLKFKTATFFTYLYYSSLVLSLTL